MYNNTKVITYNNTNVIPRDTFCILNTLVNVKLNV